MTAADPPRRREQHAGEQGALRIAMVAPPWFELPPRAYGGIEAVVAGLVDHLTLLGHEVTLIGSGRHLTAAHRFVQVFETPPTQSLGDPLPEVVNAAASAAALADIEVDIVHDHTIVGPVLARGRIAPTVVTAHGRVTGFYADYYRSLGDTVDLVAISHAQRRANRGLNWVGTVHNGIDVSTFPFRADNDGYVLWLGRFSDEKGPQIAIDAARAAGYPIVLAGKLNEPDERAFFAREITPRLGVGVEYVGEADSALKRELLAGARALVFPIQWEEPFGMVMIEAMACGTPVVAMRRGSVGEVVRDGVTGLVVEDYDELVEAIDAVSGIDPAACRAHVEESFDLSVMARGYERVYRTLVDGGREMRQLAARGLGDSEPVVDIRP
jgi:glycosyltransferase involved in cell wall biosynthesis